MYSVGEVCLGTHYSKKQRCIPPTNGVAASCFEEQFHDLRIAARQGSVDCIFRFSSVSLAALNQNLIAIAR
jgi:hypothetical protein